jgi:hypothetical protein
MAMSGLSADFRARLWGKTSRLFATIGAVCGGLAFAALGAVVGREDCGVETGT